MEFSVIITANTLEDTEDTLNSIIQQDLKFQDHVEIIIINNSHGQEIIQNYNSFSQESPNNFKFIENQEKNISMAKNESLKIASGKYLNFLNSGDTLSKNTLNDVLKLFKSNEDIPIVSIPTIFLNEVYKNHWSNKRFEKTQVVDLIENPNYYQIFGPPCFINKDCINREFKEVVIREDVVLYNELLLDNPKLGLCKTGKCFSKIILKKNPTLDDARSSKEYYYTLCNNYFENLINLSLKKYSEVPRFIKNCIMYDIGIMLHAENTQTVLQKDDIIEIKERLHNTLTHIDDDIILNSPILPEALKVNAFLLKYGEHNKSILNKLDLNTIFIDNYDIVNDELSVLANLPIVFDRSVEVFINGQEIETNKIRFPQRDGNYLDYTYIKDYSFTFKIPLSDKKDYEIEFKSNNESLSIDFSRPCNFSKTVGYAKTKKYLSILNDNKIIIEPKTTFKWIKQEFKAIKKMLKEKEVGYKVGIPFRLMYMAGYPFLKNKHIWFYMDHPDAADDNGMHIFKYAQDKDKNIKKYFILDKKSKDLSKMEKIGKVLGYKSIKHRYLGLFAENIVTSHPDNGIIYPFWGSYPHLAGLLKSNTIFLQHGIIKDDISSWLNRFNMNLSILVTSSPKEYESIFENPYHYEKGVVQLLGLPRYDNLKNETNKKQIVIMPSWRRPLTNKTKEFIKHSEYFKRFNSLINNEKLIEFAKEHDYEILYKPHPNVYNFIDLYDTNDYVKIDHEKIDYQTVFNTSSLLITDYSSVAFDFSYLHKPILYYQYTDDYHFDVEGGYFQYETMGFGEVCRTEEELVNLICEYIENDCKIKEEYSKRIDDFFYYTDKNNCKRVYDAIKKLPLKD